MIISDIIRNNINWISIKGEIIREPIAFKNLFLTPGWKIRKLGNKKRTSFCIDVDLVYQGYYIEKDSKYILFTPYSSETKVENLFDKSEWFICLIYVTDSILLSQSGAVSFYDIRL